MLYVPDFSCNILSVSNAAEKGTTMTFSVSSCVIRDTNHKAITVAAKVGGLYKIKLTRFRVYSTRHHYHQLSRRTCGTYDTDTSA